MSYRRKVCDDVESVRHQAAEAIAEVVVLYGLPRAQRVLHCAGRRESCPENALEWEKRGRRSGQGTALRLFSECAPTHLEVLKHTEFGAAERFAGEDQRRCSESVRPAR